MSLTDQLIDFSSRNVQKRGAALHALNRILSFEQLPSDPHTIRATVLGSRQYHVHIALHEYRFSHSCSCPYRPDFEDDICKHVWCVAMEAESRGFGEDKEITRVERTYELEGDDDGEDDVVTYTPLRPSPARWQPRVIPQPQWRQSLEQAPRAAPRYDPGPPRPLPEQLLYVLTESSDNVSISIQGRSRKKNGDWGVAREVKVRQEQLATLDPTDAEILSRFIPTTRTYGFGAMEIESNHELRPLLARSLVPRMAATGRLFFTNRNSLSGPLTFEDRAWTFHLRVHNVGEQYGLSAEVRSGNTTLAIDQVRGIVPGFIITAQTIAPLEGEAAVDWFWFLRSAPALNVPQDEADRFVEALAQRKLPDLELPSELNWRVVKADPIPVLRIVRKNYGAMSASLAFAYGRKIIDSARAPAEQWVENRTIYRRDLQREEAAAARLAELGLVPSYGSYTFGDEDVTRVLPALVAEGWRIDVNNTPVQMATDYEARIETAIDWFDLDAAVAYGEHKVTLPVLLAAARKRQGWVELPGGAIGLLPDDWLQRFASAVELGTETGSAIRFQRNQAFLIDALLASREKVDLDAGFRSLQRLVRENEAAPVPESEPEGFHGQLRPYQRHGLGWLSWLDRTTLGGCLADDMGLGKTIQVLAMLARLRKEERRPALVVVPKSLLFNWRVEAERFVPELTVTAYYGASRAQVVEDLLQWDLVLTTYGIVRSDIARLKDVDFEWVILDEAQAIKNPGSQIAKAVRLLRAKHRLVMTGTPVENRLTDLWSQFEFLSPGMLGTAAAFKRGLGSPKASSEQRRLLGNALRPFILRRTKEQVAPELPARSEQTLVCELEGAQRKHYDELRDHYRASLLGTIQKKGMARSKIQVLEALLRLRQAAIHPGLITGEAAEPSAKLEMLMEELDEVLESGHKALVFSQFTGMLSFVRARLEEGGLEYCHLDGKTANRQEVVDRFQSAGGPNLFLVSLKAGGVGLNLTAADYVFLLDPWWNPAVEAQAIDRTHRIGQTRPVFAYRLIAADTVEEKIIQLQQSKRDLADSIITEDNSILQKLSLQDLELLLS